MRLRGQCAQGRGDDQCRPLRRAAESAPELQPGQQLAQGTRAQPPQEGAAEGLRDSRPLARSLRQQACHGRPPVRSLSRRERRTVSAGNRQARVVVTRQKTVEQAVVRQPGGQVEQRRRGFGRLEFGAAKRARMGGGGDGARGRGDALWHRRRLLAGLGQRGPEHAPQGRPRGVEFARRADVAPVGQQGVALWIQAGRQVCQRHAPQRRCLRAARCVGHPREQAAGATHQGDQQGTINPGRPAQAASFCR